MSTLITLVLYLVLLGLLLHLVDHLPLDAAIAKLIRIVVILFGIIVVLGMLTGLVPPTLPLLRR